MAKTPNGASKESESKGREAANLTGEEDFIRKAPLYVLTRVDGFGPPRQIGRRCQQCDKETTWYKAYEAATLGGSSEKVQPPDEALKSVAYICFACGKNSITVI